MLKIETQSILRVRLLTESHSEWVKAGLSTPDLGPSSAPQWWLCLKESRWFRDNLLVLLMISKDQQKNCHLLRKDEWRYSRYVNAPMNIQYWNILGECCPIFSCSQIYIMYHESWGISLRDVHPSNKTTQKPTKTQKSRGDYGYCQVPGTRQLSPLEVVGDNSKFEPKN